jgi:2-iminobutanoate/2-iminopropanoate deaminase
MTRNVIQTSKAPRPAGHYSQAVEASGLIFVSGQLGIDPIGGDVPKDIEGQVRQTLRNIRSVLEAAGSSLENVVKLSVFLSDINDIQVLNRVFMEFFNRDPPARSTVQVVLPPKFLVEIDAMAVR